MQALRLLGSSLTEKKAEKEVERMIKEEHDRLDEASKVLWRAGYHNWASSSSREARFRQDRVLINLVHMCGATIQFKQESELPLVRITMEEGKFEWLTLTGEQGIAKGMFSDAPIELLRNALIAKNLREQEEREFEEEYLKRRRREVTRQDYIAGFRKSLDFWGAAEGGRPELAQMQEGGGGGEKLSERTKRLAEIQASIITMENSMRIAREKLLEDLGVEEELRGFHEMDGCRDFGMWRMEKLCPRREHAEHKGAGEGVEQCSCASRRTMMMCLCHRSDENNKLWLLPDGSFVLINEHASCLRTFGSGRQKFKLGREDLIHHLLARHKNETSNATA